MAHVAKYAASASGHLTAHYERQKSETGEYVRFGNQDIDTSKSHLNYNLVPHREDGQISFIQKRVSEVKCQKRKDVNVMCSWIVTLPKTRPTRSDELLGSWNWDIVERDFFERAYSFMASRYGEENVISAYVHKDENQPHIHFSFVPVTPDKKRGGFKVSAKEVLTRADLQAFHHDLEKHLDSFGDWHHEVLNEATKDGNKEIAELKQRAAHERTQKVLLEAVEAENRVANGKRRVEALGKQENGLKS
jgi:hypothetical protein